MSSKESKQEPQPKARDYALATLQLTWAGIKKHWLRTILVLAVIAGSVFGWQYWTSHHKPKLSNDDLVIRVSREVNISGDANPAILTVIDKEKVNQPFLNESKEGDKILLYYKAGKAVLYRPSADQIMKTGSFAPPDARVQIRVGTVSQERVNDVRALLDKTSGIKISTQDDSIKKDYSETVVVDVTDRYDREAESIAKKLGTTVRSLPQTESTPDADILVIVGDK